METYIENTTLMTKWEVFVVIRYSILSLDSKFKQFFKLLMKHELKNWHNLHGAAFQKLYNKLIFQKQVHFGFSLNAQFLFNYWKSLYPLTNVIKMAFAMGQNWIFCRLTGGTFFFPNCKKPVRCLRQQKITFAYILLTPFM